MLRCTCFGYYLPYKNEDQLNLANEPDFQDGFSEAAEDHSSGAADDAMGQKASTQSVFSIKIDRQ